MRRKTRNGLALGALVLASMSLAACQNTGNNKTTSAAATTAEVSTTVAESTEEKTEEVTTEIDTEAETTVSEENTEIETEEATEENTELETEEGSDEVSTEMETEEGTDEADEASAVTIMNYSVSSDGSVWEEIEQTYTEIPQRVVANNQGIADVMIRLGLEDSIVGVAAVFGEPEADIADKFNEIPVISQGYASKEAVLSVNPDMVVGRGDLFIDGDYGVGTVSDLNEQGIATYIALTSRTGSADTGSNFESFLQDIENLGLIFHVEDKAEELIAQYTEQVESLKEAYADKNLVMAEVSTVTDGVPNFGTAATESLQNEAFSMIGFTNLNERAEGASISIETVIEENPDLIILFDYEGGPDMDEMIAALYANEALQDISAIKNKKVISTEFSEIYGGSGSLYNAVEKLAEEFYND